MVGGAGVSISFSVAQYVYMPGTCGPKKGVFGDASPPFHSFLFSSPSLAVEVV